MNCKIDCKKYFSEYGATLVRIVVGLIFVIAGYGKIASGNSMFTGMLDGMGFPAAVAFAWIVAIIELVGGVLFILGYFDEVVASLLAVIIFVAIIAVHLGSWSDVRYPLLLLVVLISYIGRKGNCGVVSCMRKMKG